MKHALLWTVAGALVYLLALGHASTADVAVAIAVALALVAVFHRFVLGRTEVLPSWRRAWLVVPALGHVVADVARGTWEVTLASLALRRGLTHGMVEVAMGERSHAGAVLTAILVTLSPGSVLVSLDWDRRIMHFHLLDASRAERFRRELESFYERYQRWIVP